MKKLFLFSWIVLLLGCSSLKVAYDYDNTADFTKYKTYAFSEETLDLPINSLNRDRLITAIVTELAGKGLNQADVPDAIVDIHIKGKEVTTANATTTGGYYGRYGWGGGMSSTSVTYDTYTQGTMFISIIDKQTEKLVWQGTGSKPLNESASPQKREQLINYSVQQIMKNYPPKTNK